MAINSTIALDEEPPAQTAPVAGGTTPAPASPVTTAPTAYTPEKVNPTTRNVTSDQTVLGQVNRVLDSNSPLLERERAIAAEVANRRGLLNSTMAVQAGEAAVMDKALQIANPDAQAHQQASRDNMQAMNTASTVNAGAQNEVYARNQASQLQQDSQRLASQLDSGSRERLAAIMQNYGTMNAASQTANSTLTELNRGIQTILASPDIAQENKQGLIDKLIQSTQNTLRTIGIINGVDFGSLLNF